MFGYIKVNSAELKVKEYEIYRGAYCGLCRSMGKCTGQCSRLSLNYDFAFLVLARLVLTNTPVNFTPRRCFVHPLKRRSVMDRNDQLDACAYAAAILSYHKIRDDLADERGFKRLRARLTHPFVRSWRRRAIKSGYSELDKQVGDKLCELSRLEAQCLPSVDAPANLFGDILAEITAYGLDGNDKRIALAIGKCVGKWIYIADALDDMEEDSQKGRYNPFLLLYGGKMPSDGELDSLKDALKLELIGAESAMDLVDTGLTPLKNIMENVLYLGMPDTADSIIKSIQAKNDKQTTDNRKDITQND